MASKGRLDVVTRGTWRWEISNARYADPAEGWDLLLRGLPGARSLGARTVHQPLLRRGRKDRRGRGRDPRRARRVHRQDRKVRQGLPAWAVEGQGGPDPELLRDRGE